MAKDPAFLFYPGDWILGTLGYSLEEKGAYMELLMYQFSRGSFTENQALYVLRHNPEVWKVLKEKFTTDANGLFYNKRLAEEKEKRKLFSESRRKSRTKSDEDNVRIYIVRDNVRSTYKIGSSVNPLRRYNELSNQMAPAIMHDQVGDRDITLIWYSEPVKRTLETELHKQFENVRVAGEWFALTEQQVSSLKKKYKGTECNERTIPRTSPRTEDENENKDSLEVNVFNKKDVLTEIEIGSTIEYVSITSQKHLTKDQILKYWEAFKIQYQAKVYFTESGKLEHFRDWLKKQDHATTKRVDTARPGSILSPL